jgi:HEAT repeat protein
MSIFLPGLRASFYHEQLTRRIVALIRERIDMRSATAAVLLFLALPCAAQPAIPEPKAEAPVSPDEQAVKSAKLQATSPALLDFFRKRSLRSVEAKPVQELIKQLGDKTPETRDRAFGGLVSYGMLAVPLLRQAAGQVDDPEISTRAKECLKLIENEDGAALISSAAKLLSSANPDGAVEALLGYLSVVENAALYQEVEAALVEIAAPSGKVNEALTKALKDPVPARRATAASVVSQVGDVEQRAAVKPLLKDPRPVVRLRAALGLARRSEAEAIPVLVDLLAELPGEHRALCEEFLVDLAGDWKVEIPEGKSPLLSKIRREVWAGWWKASEGKALLDEFRQRSLANDERDKVLALIKDLGKDAEKDREKAVLALIDFGPKALPLLRKAAEDSNLRIGEGARLAIKQAGQNGLAPLPPVAAKLLALQRPEGAAEALLTFVPFADTEQLIEAIQQALPDVVMRDGKVEPAFVKALADPIPSRRIAAAEALARNGAEIAAVKKLLADADAEVKLRTAIALVKSSQKDSFASLLTLTTEVPDDLAYMADEYLSRIAGEKKPNVGLGKDPASKKKWHEAWTTWWKDNETKVSVADRPGVRRLLGYTVVVEQYNPQTGNGRVAELDATGKQRWEIHNLATPMDAQVVGEDRVLIAEQNNNRVTERNFKGEVKWEKQVIQPINVERLRNGHIFVGRRNGILEVDRDGKEVTNIQLNNHYLMGSGRLRDGTYAFVNNNNMYVHIDRTGKELKTFRVPHDPQGGGLFPTILSNGNVLLGHYGSGKVLELDRDGKTLREWKTQMPNMATSLPGGGVLVASINARKVVELDRAGRVVREFPGNMSPYKADRR